MKSRNYRNQNYHSRRLRGSSIIEMVVGTIVLLFVVLFFVDIGTLILTQTSLDRMTKNAARAAAENQTSKLARTASDQIVAQKQTSPLFGTPKTVNFNFDTNAGQVTVENTIICTLPVPLPLVGQAQVNLNAKDTETITALLAN